MRVLDGLKTQGKLGGDEREKDGKQEMEKSAYEVKYNCCLFERHFKEKKNGVLLFGISFSVLEI